MSLETAARPAQLASATFEHPLPPLPSHWQSLPRVFVHQARAHRGRQAMADSTGARLTYGQMLLRALALGRVLERTLGPAPYRRALPAADGPDRRRQRRAGALGEDPGQPELHGEPGPGRLLDRAVRDHACADVQQGARQVQDHAEGDAHPPRRRAQAGSAGRQALGGRSRTARADRRRSARSSPGSATTDSTPQPPSSSRRARPATRKGSSSRTAMS